MIRNQESGVSPSEAEDSKWAFSRRHNRVDEWGRGKLRNRRRYNVGWEILCNRDVIIKWRKSMGNRVIIRARFGGGRRGW
jgi:hypothetical protein